MKAPDWLLEMDRDFFGYMALRLAAALVLIVATGFLLECLGWRLAVPWQ